MTGLLSSLQAGATGVGSLPGADIRDAVELVFHRLDQLPFLPELPARGPGAQMVGRGAALLVGLPVDFTLDEWRLAPRPDRDARRAIEFWARDLDTLTDIADGYTGWLKTQVAGPWTLASELRLVRGGRALADAGAVRDVTDSLAEGLAAHVAEVSRRVPGARVLVQLDEPSLPAVLAGSVPTQSGLSRLTPVEPAVARDVLATVIGAAGAPVAVHCCAAGVPFALIRDSGADAVSFDATLAAASTAQIDALAEAVDAGLTPWFGVVPATGAAVPGLATTMHAMRDWERLLGRRLDTGATTPTCGLAGATTTYAASALTHCAEVAHRWFTLGER